MWAGERLPATKKNKRKKKSKVKREVTSHTKINHTLKLKNERERESEEDEESRRRRWRRRRRRTAEREINTVFFLNFFSSFFFLFFLYLFYFYSLFSFMLPAICKREREHFFFFFGCPMGGGCPSPKSCWAYPKTGPARRYREMKRSGRRRRWAFSCAAQCKRKNEIEGGQRVIRTRMFMSFMFFFFLLMLAGALVQLNVALFIGTLCAFFFL